MASIFWRWVVAGMTAMNGSPRSLAKYASEIAVLPLELSITGVPSEMYPFTSAYRNSDLPMGRAEAQNDRPCQEANHD
jgi:hypothetical protein